MCIYIAHENCITLHLYSSCHIKEKRAEFFFFIYFFFFCFLVRNENIKKIWCLYVRSKKGFLEFSTAKQLNNIRNTCEYCDLLEL